MLRRLVPPGSRRRRYGIAARNGLGLGPPTGVAARSDPPGLPSFLPADHPDVSIVVPVHDQWAMTERCLRSVAADPASVSYEVIVVDDASSDETPDRLRQLRGVRIVHLADNQGFLGATNAGIRVARGRYVVLLNNDTEVGAGWIDALVGTADADPSAGVVGAKLVYPDGRLQEAGGVIYRDGSGHNYGRDEDPGDPRFNFLREVDYCSGACLLVRRELLDAVGGGLDPRFAPAYYEDTDLCFAARAHSYRVLYQPRAVVVHFEGGSHGTDVASGVKRHQLVNQAVFVDKWAGSLARQHEPDWELRRLASWRTAGGRALVVDHQVPRPDQDSGSRRMYELLRLLSGLGLGVTFVPQDAVLARPYHDDLASFGVEVLGGPGDLDAYLRSVGPGLHLVVLSRPTVAWANYPMVRSLVPDVPIVYDTVDLHYLRERRRASVEGTAAALRSADYHHGIEMSLAHLTDQVWTVSPEERDALVGEDPTLDVAVVPNIHRVSPPGPSFDERAGIVFVGNFRHQPNVDAARWLVAELLPRVRSEIAGVPLHLVGDDPAGEVHDLAGDGVTVHGWLPSLEGLYAQVRMAVAPLRFGAGMKGKVGESLAFGVPVVTTTTGAEGMGLRHGHDVLVADDADGLARAMVDAYRDPRLWGRLAANGRDTVARHYSPASVGPQLRKVLGGLGVPVGPDV